MNFMQNRENLNFKTFKKNYKIDYFKNRKIKIIY